jgi:hypothetical protein
VRCHAALGFIRRSWLQLEALRPTWEGGPTVYLSELQRTLSAIERARDSLEGDGGNDVTVRAAGAVREALEWWRRAAAKAGERLDDEEPALSATPPDLGALLDYACARDPALAGVPPEAWARATERWPGLQAKRGGARSKGAKAAVTWQDVVYDLLKPAGLTTAKNARSILGLWNKSQKK